MEGLKDYSPRTSYVVFKTNIGWCGLVTGKKELKRIFIGYKKRHHLLANINREFQYSFKKPPSGELIKKINLYFSGKKISFNKCKIDCSSLTLFQSKVLRATIKIPYGKVVTYGEIAKTIGHPKSARAVGNALSKNPFPLIVPCHRVVRGDGRTGGFSAGGGKGLKEKLLRMEQGK
jgi:methylated-DNA-[protein]-cysteine S-methyltransferase